MSFEANLAALNVELPPAPKAMGLYKPAITVGNLVYLSGHGPLSPDGTLQLGKVGKDVEQEVGNAAARQTGLAMLATLKAHLGSLDKIKRLVKTFGMVNCVDDFTQQPAVINGFSELMKEVFGEDCGVAARSAIGVNSLPAGMTVEVEAIFELNAE
ncbi:RidA family protein [Bremerella cremea]|uniref:RidA family protein n=1 Tax=Bremerella cremea TaxID=1031537 RepID=A0A368KY76_9BACT|nr:RidA family protein [Bremerella cremea]RCS54735.1 RidA family protein [Bremerella cremea]